MSSRVALLLPLLLLAGGVARADERVAVEGSERSFPTTASCEVEGKPVSLTLTGVALREKAWFNVYVIASYLENGAKAATPSALAQADVVKLLHLVLERDVDGEDMSEALEEAISANYPDQFASELQAFRRYFSAHPVKEGDSIRFTHLPKVGVECVIQGQEPLVIRSVTFSRAVWDIYLGPKNVGDAIKQGLTSRLSAKKP